MRYLARDGLTSPTKCIRTRFYRKKYKIPSYVSLNVLRIHFEQQEAREVEKSFQAINQVKTRFITKINRVLGAYKEQEGSFDSETGGRWR